MNFSKIITILGTFTMGAALIYGFSAGTLSQDGAALVKMPWGLVSLIDLCGVHSFLRLDFLPREKLVYCYNPVPPGYGAG
jgi:hypothetical protein